MPHFTESKRAAEELQREALESIAFTPAAIAKMVQDRAELLEALKDAHPHIANETVRQRIGRVIMHVRGEV